MLVSRETQRGSSSCGVWACRTSLPAERDETNTLTVRALMEHRAGSGADGQAFTRAAGASILVSRLSLLGASWLETQRLARRGPTEDRACAVPFR